MSVDLMKPYVSIGPPVRPKRELRDVEPGQTFWWKGKLYQQVGLLDSSNIVVEMPTGIETEIGEAEVVILTQVEIVVPEP